MDLRFEKITDDFPELEKVDSLIQEAFPPEEYVPFYEGILHPVGEGFDSWAIYDGTLFVGMMFVVTQPALAYLSYFAVHASLRGKGYGKRALEGLSRLYPGFTQVLDMEPVDPQANNYDQRLKRRKFYLNNGYKATELFIRYFGVTYELLYKGETFDAEAFKKLLKKISLPGFDPVIFPKNE